MTSFYLRLLLLPSSIFSCHYRTSNYDFYFLYVHFVACLPACLLVVFRNFISSSSFCLRNCQSGSRHWKIFLTHLISHFQFTSLPDDDLVADEEEAAIYDVKIWQRNNKKMTVGTIHSHQKQQQHQRHFFAAPSTAVNQQYHLMDTKGLLNGPGQNNCFLNCAVQVSHIFHVYL